MSKIGGNRSFGNNQKVENTTASSTSNEDVVVAGNEVTETEVTNEVETVVVPESEVLENTNIEASDEVGQVPEKKPAKVEKVLAPEPWQRVETDVTGKKLLVKQITFLGEKIDYNTGLKHKYKFTNLDPADGNSRVITGKFPKTSTPTKTWLGHIQKYTIEVSSYGESCVCKLTEDDGNKVILEYISLSTVIDVLQDLMNPTDVCVTTWGTLDQVIKFKRGLKSRIKSIGIDDLPASNRKAASEVTKTTEPVETAEVRELEEVGV